uniref:Uncharacterized protein n=1 Tax=Meloidogyne enterolobii TaxID=390850 RepID=A0A6V7WLV0_MELEN|nr:unnamed protein product [Meloidogyne enterolobii]
MNEHKSLEEIYNELFGPDHDEDVVPASQGYVHHDPSFYEHHDLYSPDAQYEQDTLKAIEESGREMPRGRGGPLIRGKEKNKFVYIR